MNKVSAESLTTETVKVEGGIGFEANFVSDVGLEL